MFEVPYLISSPIDLRGKTYPIWHKQFDLIPLSSCFTTCHGGDVLLFGWVEPALEIGSGIWD